MTFITTDMIMHFTARSTERCNYNSWDQKIPHKLYSRVCTIEYAAVDFWNLGTPRASIRVYRAGKLAAAERKARVWRETANPKGDHIRVVRLAFPKWNGRPDKRRFWAPNWADFVEMLRVGYVAYT